HECSSSGRLRLRRPHRPRRSDRGRAARSAEHSTGRADVGGGRPRRPGGAGGGAGGPAGLGLRLSLKAKRLLTRGWPAPLVVAVPAKADWPTHWSAAVREKLATAPARFRCPEHPLFETLTPALEMPLLVVDTFLATAEAVLDLLEDSDALAV